MGGGMYWTDAEKIQLRCAAIQVAKLKFPAKSLY
jgi:hypothetical protein